MFTKHESLSILVVNPNSSSSITHAIERSLRPHVPSNTIVDFFNPSIGPAGISDEATAKSSCEACMTELPPILHKYDGVLVACFSEHLLITELRIYASEKGILLSVLGIYHAGVATAMLQTTRKFGIIATGTGIKTNLIEATAKFLGSTDSNRFAGPITTGLSVVELQEGDQAKVERNMKATTKGLVKAGAEVIVLGCGGMCGMEHWIREAAYEEGKEIKVVDGARMGLQMIVALIRGQ
ncbi:hypothetical protein I203_104440 [Kwoniella mangroviensis CBS 8507]|uniref:uncharacterized protein n=1 Tax=Kwoniella mangroviensis CBS 8507 TaxID=1296122 RepID=UPI00080D3E23|nr:uncharacterized protein I203_00614 [Kwoniella mangroviensis CBS 8507]OCF70479.1 hypothetical protein I203_00614 [Kwoniella mangroviensis CBS 8507]